MSDEAREHEARDLRIEIGKLARSRDILEGLALAGDLWAEVRLGDVHAAMRKRMARLADLSLDKPKAARR